jgi:two-component system OmpR family response regulator
MPDDVAKYRVLVVDDDVLQLDVVSRTLRAFGFEVATSQSAIGVTNSVRAFKPDVVLVDVNIPEMSGDKVVEVVRRLSQGAARYVFYSACDEATLRKLAAQSRADGWITKSTVGLELAAKLRTFCAVAPRAGSIPDW